MQRDDFHLPIRIIEREGEPVREIYSAGEALDFLMAWRGQTTAAHEAAIEKCFAAANEVEDPDVAQDAFHRFARLAGIMSPDMMRLPERPGGFSIATRF